jgi:hypothetical protein
VAFDDHAAAFCRFIMTTCLFQLETNCAEQLKRSSSAISWLTFRSRRGQSHRERHHAPQRYELKLKKGDSVSAVVKATEVMIQKD